MSDFQTEMNRVVAGFVAQITDLARAAARDMIDEALGRGGKISIGGFGRGGAGRGRGRGAKRTSDELDRLAVEGGGEGNRVAGGCVEAAA